MYNLRLPTPSSQPPILGSGVILHPQHYPCDVITIAISIIKPTKYASNLLALALHHTRGSLKITHLFAKRSQVA